jgi:type I restriction enzyme R subunit
MIVDYIGVFKNIERALALYANTGAGNPDDIIREKHELLNELKKQLKATYDFLEEIEIDIPKLLEVHNQDKLLLIESYANKIVSDQQKKKKYLNLSSDTYNSYKSLLPDPEAENYYSEVMAIKVIASRVREVSLESIDVSQVKKDLEALLDKSIQAGNYVVPHYKKMKDLSTLDADALHRFFAEIENKNIQVEKLKTELTDKIEEMVRKNRTRERFIKRLSKLLDMYNSGAHDIEHIFEGMIELAKSLDEEEQRAVKENLSEDELAIFDLLLKENLNPNEVDRIKAVAKDLWAKLKTEKLVLDWREKESTRAGVKSTIFDVLYNELPEPTYEESDCEEKGITVYNFVYDTYV